MFEKSKYIERRQKLMSLVKQGLIVLLGNKEVSLNYPSNTYAFRQDSSFLYFVGLDIPNIAAIIDVDQNETILYGDNIDIEDVIWMGNLPTMDELAAQSGISKVKPFRSLASDLSNAIKNNVKTGKQYQHKKKNHGNVFQGINAPPVN